eukprot:49429-Eustigmatos_ZCMA.PRE.1
MHAPSTPTSPPSYIRLSSRVLCVASILATALPERLTVTRAAGRSGRRKGFWFVWVDRKGRFGGAAHSAHDQLDSQRR